MKHCKIEVVPNGVDTELFLPVLESSHAKDGYNLNKSPTVVFVGNMEYLPNREAAQIIASEIAPRVRKEIDDAVFAMVGRSGGLDYTDLTFTGVVENVAAVLATSNVAIAPLLQGSGTRLKILEYLSCGLPVVSTSVGVEGLDVKNGIHVLIEDNIDEFPTKVLYLLKDRMAAMRLGKAARELVVAKFDWKIIVERLDKVYRNLLFQKTTSQTCQ
jgi:glycosyltransferase involved in cell wall biosynthesis